MGVFKRHDFVGVIMAMLFLILVYLLLNNFYATNQLAGTVLNSSNTIMKTLQGR